MHYRASDLKGLQQQRLGTYFRAKSENLDREAAGATQLAAEELGRKAEKSTEHEIRRIGLFRRWRSARA